MPEQRKTPEKVTVAVPDYDTLWCELRDPQADQYVSGWGVIIRGADVPPGAVEAALSECHGDDVNGLVSEVQHLHYMPRVKRCSNYDGFGCDNEGEWHAHWLSVKHNPAAPDCCYTLALPVWATHKSPVSTTREDTP